MNRYSCRLTFKLQARWVGAGAPVLAVLLGLAGPAQAQEPRAETDTAQTVDRVIEVRMASFRYHPDTLRIPSEETVRLVFHNEGTFPHEFMAGRTVTDEQRGYRQDLFEGVQVEKSTEDENRGPESGASSTQWTRIEVTPDSTQSLTFRLPATKDGEWEMGCFLTDPALHYKAGMKGTIFVE